MLKGIADLLHSRLSSGGSSASRAGGRNDDHTGPSSSRGTTTEDNETTTQQEVQDRSSSTASRIAGAASVAVVPEAATARMPSSVLVPTTGNRSSSDDAAADEAPPPPSDAKEGREGGDDRTHLLEEQPHRAVPHELLRILERNTSNLGRALSCSICQSTPSHNAVLLSECVHLFCPTCLQMALKNQSKKSTLQCPVCRQVVTRRSSMDAPDNYQHATAAYKQLLVAMGLAPMSYAPHLVGMTQVVPTASTSTAAAATSSSTNRPSDALANYQMSTLFAEHFADRGRRQRQQQQQQQPKQPSSMAEARSPHLASSSSLSTATAATTALEKEQQEIVRINQRHYRKLLMKVRGRKKKMTKPPHDSKPVVARERSCSFADEMVDAAAKAIAVGGGGGGGGMTAPKADVEKDEDGAQRGSGTTASSSSSIIERLAVPATFTFAVAATQDSWVDKARDQSAADAAWEEQCRMDEDVDGDEQVKPEVDNGQLQMDEEEGQKMDLGHDKEPEKDDDMASASAPCRLVVVADGSAAAKKDTGTTSAKATGSSAAAESSSGATDHPLSGPESWAVAEALSRPEPDRDPAPAAVAVARTDDGRRSIRAKGEAYWFEKQMQDLDEIELRREYEESMRILKVLRPPPSKSASASAPPMEPPHPSLPSAAARTSPADHREDEKPPPPEPHPAIAAGATEAVEVVEETKLAHEKKDDEDDDRHEPEQESPCILVVNESAAEAHEDPTVATAHAAAPLDAPDFVSHGAARAEAEAATCRPDPATALVVAGIDERTNQNGPDSEKLGEAKFDERRLIMDAFRRRQEYHEKQQALHRIRETARILAIRSRRLQPQPPPPSPPPTRPPPPPPPPHPSVGNWSTITSHADHRGELPGSSAAGAAAPHQGEGPDQGTSTATRMEGLVSSPPPRANQAAFEVNTAPDNGEGRPGIEGGDLSSQSQGSGSGDGTNQPATKPPPLYVHQRDDLASDDGPNSVSAAQRIDGNALTVGTVVNVAPRTWPGMNKLGGVGRITKVHEVGDDGIAYSIQYVLGGTESRVDAVFVTMYSDDGMGTTTAEEHGAKQPDAASVALARRHRKSNRLEQHNVAGWSPALIEQLASEGFDVAAVGPAGKDAFHSQRKRPTHDTGADQQRPSKLRRVGSTVADFVRRRLPRGGQHNADTGKDNERSRNQKENKPHIETVPTPPPTPPSLPRYSSTELCRRADEFYCERVRQATSKGCIYVAASSLNDEDNAALDRLCKDTKSCKVQVKRVDQIDAKKTTLCIVPTVVDSGTNDAGSRPDLLASKRTFKAMQAALAGIPLVSSSWLRLCQDHKEACQPLPNMWIRSLPGTSTDTAFGVARLAAHLHDDSSFRPLAGAAIHFFGSIPRQKEADMSSLLRDAGATLVPNTSAFHSHLSKSTSQVTAAVLVCGTNVKLGRALEAKVRQMAPGTVYVVDPSWVFDCVSSGQALEPSAYEPIESGPQARELWKLTNAKGEN